MGEVPGEQGEDDMISDLLSGEFAIADAMQKTTADGQLIKSNSKDSYFPGSSRPNTTAAEADLSELFVPPPIIPNHYTSDDQRNGITEGEGMGDGESFTNEGLWPSYCNPHYRMPNQIEVRTSLASGDYYFAVQIVKAATYKPYLGGYRNKASGSIYHHAGTQTPTDNKRPIKDTSHLRSRDTQTSETRTLSVQPYRESGTQMERVDLRLDNKRDVVKIPKPYFTAEKLLVLKKLKTIVIQRCWRGYMARCRAHRMRMRNLELARKEQEDREEFWRQDRERKAADMNRRMHPQNNADFATLFNEMDIWRRGEIAKIKANTAPGEERAKALAAVLADETKALQGIQKLKIAAHKNLHTEKTQRMLELMAQPHRWQLSGGETAFVQTPETVRSKELLDLYVALQAPSLSTDERLDILLHVKWTVKEFDNNLCRDIADLVDREADLLNRGRPSRSVEKLRIRLSNMFLSFVEDPAFNPRAAEFVGRVQQI